MLFNTESQVEMAAQGFIESMVEAQCCMFDDMTAEEQLGALATVDMIRLMAMSMASDILDEFKVSVLAKIESIQFDPKFEVELNSSLTFATSKSTREPDLYD